MKHIAVLVALLLMAGVAFAEETGRGNYVTPIAPVTNWLNTNSVFEHSHTYEQFKLDDEYGLGANIVLYDFREVSVAGDWGIDSVGVEYKYDFGNENNQVYGVINVNLAQTVRNIFQ